MWPHHAIELLFFAIFGQTTHENFKVVHRDKQEYWTTAFFKLAFGIYMLVSVVVLINLLIAMMSDTYQRIQAQSDIEWKYGLSKLIRNMHRTTTAPSPLNLVTSWVTYLYKTCKKRRHKKERPSLANMMGIGRHRSGHQLSPRSKMGAKWLSRVKKTHSQVAHKDSVTLSIMHLSPLGSQLSFGNATRIETICDWDVVRRKYRELHGDDSAAAGSGDNKGSSEAGEKSAGQANGGETELLAVEDTTTASIITFSIYMLVTVIVLINLLIAMMSDTYQTIQAQSDTEWKYGLSKLIRNMQKTTMEPSPLNLITSWTGYLHKSCKTRRETKKRMSVMNGFIARRLPKSPFSQVYAPTPTKYPRRGTASVCRCYSRVLWARSCRSATCPPSTTSWTGTWCDASIELASAEPWRNPRPRRRTILIIIRPRERAFNGYNTKKTIRYICFLTQFV
ncbi:unnamed protein product [Trichogramma brassicae]|uniref:Ion transport domain-containing protein n=1 Tax=Trichogramma brassicae TaxID=86971 RepID=A0A6H5I9W4_9HYME|nr:unnamed protein product [Trichogramma brassicae]